MELVASKIILFITLIVCSYAANKTGLIALTDYDCGCPGQNASYTCTAFGGVLTVWGGTAFNCIGRNEISLLHNQFGTGNAIGVCNDGALVAYGTQAVENFFTSRLDVRLSADLQGRTITCSVDDGNVTSLGTRTLIVSTVTSSALPPPPRSINTTLIANNIPHVPGELVFRWNRVLESEYNCSMLQYNFTSQNCGSCAEVTPQVVSCSGFQVSSAGITCTFTVSSVVCGNITGPGSMQSANVNLKVPDAPISVQTLPRYQDGQIQILTGLMTTFPTVAPTFITNGIDGSIQNYTITYFHTFGSNCGSANIPASSCVDGICTHSFDILQSSLCPPSTTIIVSVVASNILGSGIPSAPVIRDGINNLVSVKFDLNERSILCTFLNQPPNVMKQCSANITYGEDCDRFLGVFSGMGTEDTVATQQLEAVPGVIDYCFLVTAEINNVMVLVSGTLTINIIDSQVNVTAAIAIPPAIALLMIIVVIVVVEYLSHTIRVRTQLKINSGKSANIKYLEQRSLRVIEYLVKDEVGALASTLEVISEMGINISGVNPDHLPEDVVRAGQTTEQGFEINFIECSIDQSTKERLFNKLKTHHGAIEVENHDASSDDSEVDEDPDYTIIKVAIHNETGSLKRILKGFHDLKINIHGVNVLEVAFPREIEIPYKHYHLEITAIKLNEQEATLKKRLLADGLAIDIKPFDLTEYQEADQLQANDVQNFLQSHYESAETENTAESELDITLTSNVIQFLVRDEVGALANALQIFNELEINITRVNPVHLAQEHQDKFVECSCPEVQRESLINKLKSYGATNAEEVKHVDANYCVMKFSVCEAGSIVKVLKAFSDMGIRNLKFNPPHINVHNQYVECCCTEDKQMKLLKRLKKVIGVTDAAIITEPGKLVSNKPTDDSNYCIIKYFVDEKAGPGSLVRALRVFSNLQINIIGVNTLNVAFNRTIPVKFKHNHVELLATDKEIKELKCKLLETGLAFNVRRYNRIKHSDDLELFKGLIQSENNIALTRI